MDPRPGYEARANWWVQQKLASLAPLLREAFLEGLALGESPKTPVTPPVPLGRSSSIHDPIGGFQTAREDDVVNRGGPNPALVLHELPTEEFPGTWRKVYHRYGPYACRGPALIVTRAVYTDEKNDFTLLRKISGHPVYEDEAPICGSCGAAIDPYASSDLDWAEHLIERQAPVNIQWQESPQPPLNITYGTAVDPDLVARREEATENLWGVAAASSDPSLQDHPLFSPTVLMADEEEEALSQLADELKEWTVGNVSPSTPVGPSPVEEQTPEREVSQETGRQAEASGDASNYSQPESESRNGSAGNRKKPRHKQKKGSVVS